MNFGIVSYCLMGALVFIMNSWVIYLWNTFYFMPYSLSDSFEESFMAEFFGYRPHEKYFMWYFFAF